MEFNPKFKITSDIVNALMKIEASKETIKGLPVSPKLLLKLRDTAKLQSIHYSTMIEGNRLTQDEVNKVIKEKEHFPNRKRDEKEVLGYYAALEEVESLAKKKIIIKEETIKKLHALIMSGGKIKVKPTEYRDGQNVIRDSIAGSIVYLPPEAKDVPMLMKSLVEWINSKKNNDLAYPLKAAIFHYQFATIHPYYDGNGRTARLITTLILHIGGYDLKGIYSLDEYYVENLRGYYEAIAIGPSHNYYMGREKADITKWIEYFCMGMAEALEKVKNKAQEISQQEPLDKSQLLRKLDPRKRKALVIFEKSETLYSSDIEKLFKVKPRTATKICQDWVSDGFLMISDPSKKARKYKLHSSWSALTSF
jgi:Fic family protein